MKVADVRREDAVDCDWRSLWPPWGCYYLWGWHWLLGNVSCFVCWSGSPECDNDRMRISFLKFLQASDGSLKRHKLFLDLYYLLLKALVSLREFGLEVACFEVQGQEFC